ncbi:MAG: hypothetical protein FJ403_00595 [Verrucomicrobia bacterium]|nr:hypothetical protein [Verrucomicrobiota bacterium]
MFNRDSVKRSAAPIKVTFEILAARPKLDWIKAPKWIKTSFELEGVDLQARRAVQHRDFRN